MSPTQEESKVLQLRARIYLHPAETVGALINHLKTTLSEGHIHLSTAGGRYRLEIDVDTVISDSQGKAFIQAMRSLDDFVAETVYLSGWLGNRSIYGYIGPERERKELSRSRLEQIVGLYDALLPEHKVLLQSMLATS